MERIRCWGIAFVAASSWGCYTGVHVDGRGSDPTAGADGGDGASDDEGDGGDDSDEPWPEPNDEPPAPGEEFECDSDVQDPGPTLARRLNRAEILASVQDVLGVDATDLADELPPDYRAEGFTNTANALIVTTDDVEHWADAAETIVSRIPSLPTWVSGLTSCTGFTEACQTEFIENAGLKLFRRPVTPAEIAAMTPLFEHHEGEGDTFADGAASVVEAMLQAPPFLYRLESQSGESADGPYRDLGGYEIASRLSYLVWGSAPDDTLVALAEDGSLSEPSVRVEQVRRMVDASRSRETSRRYLGDWAHLDRLHHLPGDLNDDLRDETEATFDELVWEEGRPLPELLNAEYTFANEALATHYGLPSQGPGLQRYALADVPERSGILTQGAVLSWEDGTGSMVQRGLFVVREVVCGSIDPPPAGVNDERPTTEPGKSKRYYAEERMSTSPCGGCHSLIDSIAFAFEKYDGHGAFMEVDEHGNELRSDGQLNTQFHDNVPFDDAAELADILAADDRVAECMLLNVAQFSLGRRLAVADGCMLKAVRKKARKDGFGYVEILEGIVKQDAFAQIRVDEGEG